MEEIKPQGVVTARKCEECDHHEMGITTKQGKFIPFKPGMIVEIMGRKESDTKEMALSILKQRMHTSDFDSYTFSDTMPRIEFECRIPHQEPEIADCWYIVMSYTHRKPKAKSSRLICVSKTTGEIVYEGVCKAI